MIDQTKERKLSEAEQQLRAQNEELAAARDALEAERQRYAELFDRAPVAYLETDVRGVVRDANRAAGELLNVPAPLLVGTTLSKYVAGRRDLSSRLRLLAQEREEDRWELLLEPRGRPPVHAQAFVRRAAGAAETLCWTLLEIEEHTAELDQERVRLATILQQIPIGLVMVEAPTGWPLVWNEEAARVLALSSPDAESVAAAVAGGSWPLARVLRTGETVTERIELVRGDDTRLLVEVNAAPVRAPNGRLTAAFAVFQDVTARDRVERAEREFVTNAAHELQTPLAAITSAIEVLQAGAKDDPEARDRFLDHVQAESHRLARLVHSLLVLARVQAGAESPRAEPVRLRPLLDDVALSIHPAAGVVVRVECPARLTALADATLLEQAILNVASNAAKYTRVGEIVLRARPVGDGAAIEVADTGSSLPAGEEERAFDRFYRIGGRDRTGFGLGLAIAREAVEALGGTVHLRRRGGQGAVARIVVPLASQRR